MTPSGRDASPLPGPLDPWRPGRLVLPPDLVLRLAGYRRPTEAGAEVHQATARAAGRAGELAQVEARLALLAVRAAGPDGVTLDPPGSPGGDRAEPSPAGPGTRLSGATLGRLLAECPRVVAFVLTLGPDLEAEAARLAEDRQILESYLLGTAGWALLEVSVRLLRRQLAARWAPDGFRLTHRLGPGHGDWPLDQQGRLLALLGLGPGPGPVTLSAHGVLVPFKSISGLFGLRRL